MKFTHGSGEGLWRTRWAAIGAAVAVALGAGGLLIASAADSAPSSFIAVTPVRVVDSRVPLGLAGALVAAQPTLVQVTGSVATVSGTTTVVPTGATAVVANVTAVNSSSSGFVSVRPGDATGVPSTSSLNFTPGQIVANEFTVQLATTGDVQVYFGGGSGTVDLVIDVVGYYVPASAGPAGPPGIQGVPGIQGEPGIQGPAGSGIAAEFFALMPPDNGNTVAIGTDVEFPQDGPNSSAGIIARLSATTFNLATIGIYRVSFQVPVTEAGQLILTLDGIDLDYTVVGRATGTSQIIETALIETTVENSIVTVRNPAGNLSALTISPNAGGARSASASLLIELVQ